MIVNTLKKCCMVCECPDIEIEEHSYITGKKEIHIYCSHDMVCYKYNKKEEEDS